MPQPGRAPPAQRQTPRSPSICQASHRILHSRRLPICFRIIALVRDNGAGINIGTEVEEHFEVAAVARFAAGQMEANRIAVEIGLEMDLD
jgi:hypothetical protein